MAKPLLSRSGRSNPFGKLTQDIGKLKLTESTYEALLPLANEAGTSILEYCRSLIDIRVHGIDMIKTINEDRLNLIAGIGNESSPE